MLSSNSKNITALATDRRDGCDSGIIDSCRGPSVVAGGSSCGGGRAVAFAWETAVGCCGGQDAGEHGGD